jgi:DNA-binding SARP family transcriptional activator
MRPLVKLMGRGEVHLDGSLADVKLTRKLWYVLALLAIAPDAEMLRTELTALAWPLSDERSRDVLMH